MRTVEDGLRGSKRHIGPGVSVEVDWLGALPETHLILFRSNSEELEAWLGMLGVSMNEAVTLYRDGSRELSFEIAILVSGLCRRFCQDLDNLLCSLEGHSQAYGTDPSVASLKPADYCTDYGLQAALSSSLWNLAIDSRPRRFLNKVRALGAMVNHIGSDVFAS